MAEIVISITLIVMVSVAAYASCALALKSSNSNNLEILQLSDVESVELSARYAIADVEYYHQNQTKFLQSFFQHLAWSWNCGGLGNVCDVTPTEPVYFYDEGYNVPENANYGLQGISVEHVSAESKQNANCWVITRFGVNYVTKCILDVQNDSGFTLSFECTKNNSDVVYYQKSLKF